MSVGKEALAGRAVTCKHWRPLAGMADDECRIAHVEDDGSLHIVTFHGGMDDWVEPEAFRWPDLDDPATQGCVEFGLLAEKFEAEVSVVKDGEWWLCVEGRDVVLLPGCRSKAEALVAALEAAP